MSSISDLLSRSHSSLTSMASSYVPSDEDKQNLKNFCKVHLEIKQLKGGVTQNTKSLLSKNKEVKNVLMEQMKQTNTDIFKINESKFVRLSKITRTIPISFEVLREVFQNFNEEMMEEEEDETDDKIKFVTSIVNKLKLMSKSLSNQIRVTTSVPRGTNPQTILEAPEDIKQLSIILDENSFEIKNIRSQTRNNIKEKKTELDNVKKNVDEYLQKANLSNQQISYNESPFTLTKRVTVSKPKINVGVVETFLVECCSEIESSLKGKRPKDLNSFFLKNKLKILEKLEEKLLLLPQEQKSNIYLRKLNDIQEEGEEEDDRDDEEEIEE
jgi:hypothetical protein